MGRGFERGEDERRRSAFIHLPFEFLRWAREQVGTKTPEF